MAKRRFAKPADKRFVWILRFVLVALVAIVFFKAVQLHSQIDAKNQSLADINEQIRNQMVRNEVLADQVDNAEDHLEHNAYEDGYYYPGQQILQSDAG